MPQTIDRFERIVVQGIRSQEVRREPATVAEMREAAQDVRSRVFVLFLDPRNVDSNTSVNVDGALSNTAIRSSPPTMRLRARLVSGFAAVCRHL